MLRSLLIFAVSLMAVPALAGSVTANVTLPRGTIISASDISVATSTGEAKEQLLATYVGQEVRRTIYEGYRLNPAYVGNPILVKRNTRVNMVYRLGRMEIKAWGRSLEEGGEGDVITIMNMESRKKVQGVINSKGIIEVSP